MLLRDSSAALRAAFTGVVLSVPPAAQIPSPEQPHAAARPAQISEYVRSDFQDRDGELWFGTNSDGVAHYDGKSLRYLGPSEGLPGRAVRAILQHGDGSLWFATERGVSRYQYGMFTNYTVANGLAADDTW